MSETAEFIEAARSMIGVPFLLHGRRPETGLDCVGLVAACLGRIGRKAAAPTGYGLRNSSIEAWLCCAGRSGFHEATGRAMGGDLLLAAPSPGQHHLLILEDGTSVIHAHAGLRRVVRQPVPPGLDIEAQWRLAPQIGD